ncbi:MFS transporter [Chloroflexota bacterium]
MSKRGQAGQTFLQWGGLTAIFFTFTHLSHDLATGLLPALLPLIRADLSLNYFQSSLLLSAFTITSGISQFPGGWLGDRFSRYAVASAGLCGVGLAAIAIGLSVSYYPLLAILIVMGIFAGSYHPSATSMLSGFIEEARRGKAIAMHMLGGSIGFTLGPILGGLIAALLGWRFSYIILSVLPFMAVILIWQQFRPREHALRERVKQAAIKDSCPSDPAPKRPGIWQVLRPIALVTSLAVVAQLIAGSAMAFIPVYLVDQHAIAPAAAAMLMGVVRGGGIAGSLFGGWLSDKWGRDNALALALAAIGPILYFLNVLPFPFIIATFVLFGFVMYMRQVTIQTWLMDSTPPQLRATIFGIYFGLSMEGMSLAQPLAGHFMDIYGITDVFYFIAMASLGLSLTALILIKGPALRRFFTG